jgi:TRAP-type mannitol/chloroaromatic compound transport system permease small subunit
LNPQIAAIVKTIDRINDMVGKIVCFGLIPLTLIAMFEVVMRYFFNHPTIWAWDVNRQIAAALGILGAGYALLYDKHPLIDVVVTRFPPQRRALVDLITGLIFLLTFVLLLWKSMQFGWMSFSQREALNSYWAPPIFQIKMLLPVGIFLLLIQGIAKFIRDFFIVYGTTSERGIAK